MLAYRGIFVTHKTVREWAEKFGRGYANSIRCRSPRLGDKWHLDQAVITIKGERHFLWRAVDADGFVLGVLVQKRRDTKAAKRFIRKLLSGQGVAPRVMVTDKLGSYGAANRAFGLTVCDHRQNKGLNSRAENSHQPIRRRDRVMERHNLARHLQRFASIRDPIYNLYHFSLNRFSSTETDHLRKATTVMWREIASLKAALKPIKDRTMSVVRLKLQCRNPPCLATPVRAKGKTADSDILTLHNKRY